MRGNRLGYYCIHTSCCAVLPPSPIITATMHNITGDQCIVTIKDTTLGPSDTVSSSKSNSSICLRAMTASPASTLRSKLFGVDSESKSFLCDSRMQLHLMVSRIDTSTSRAQLSNGFLYPRSTVHSVVEGKNNGKARCVYLQRRTKDELLL